jgi:hypothetical protein
VSQPGHETEAADDGKPFRARDRRTSRHALAPSPPVLTPCRAARVSPVEQGSGCPREAREDGKVDEASGYGGECGGAAVVLAPGDGRDQGQGQHPPALD